MEDGSFYPSIYIKTLGQRCLFVKNFLQTQAPNSKPATCGAVAFFNGVLQSHLAPADQGSSLAIITLKLSSSMKGRSNVSTYLRISQVTSEMAAAPIHRVKLLMQCQNEMIKSGRLSLPYKGVYDCFARTVRNEGIISLWKGNTARMMGLMTSTVMKGYMAGYFIDVFNYNKDKDSRGKRLAKALAANSLSQAVTLILVHPLVYARTRMANDIITKSNINKKQFNGLIDVFRKTLRSGGIAGVYRGYNILLAGWLVHDLLFFLSKEYLRYKMHHSQASGGIKNSHNKRTVSIQLVGLPVFATLITYPVDTVIRRMMMRSGEAIKYKSSFDAFSQIIKKEGVKSLYKGASVHTSRFICCYNWSYNNMPMILNKYRSCSLVGVINQLT